MWKRCSAPGVDTKTLAQYSGHEPNMHCRLYALLAFAAFAVLPAVPTWSQSPSHVVVLCDASYSMGLPIHADHRSALELLIPQAQAYVASLPPATRVAVLITEHDGDLFVTQPYTTDRGAVIRSLAAVEPWGRTALTSPIRQAFEYLLDAGTPGELVLLTDGVDTGRLLAGHTTFDQAVPREVRFSVLTLPPTAAVSHNEELLALSEQTGGFGRIVSAPTADSAATGPAPGATLAEPAERSHSYASTHEAPPTPPLSERGATVAVGTSRPRGWALSPTAYALALAIITAGFGTLLLVFLVRELRWAHRARRIRSHNAIPPTAVLEVVLAGGGRTDVTLRSFPASVGTHQTATVTVPARNEEDSFELTCDLAEETLIVSSNHEMKVNGRHSQHADLVRGDYVRIGRYTIYFEGVLAVRHWRLPRPEHRTLLWPVAAAALLLAAVGVLGRSTRGLVTTDQSSVEDHRPPTEPPANTPAGSRDLRVYTPGEAIDYFKADYLIIHAHPDDEALDFGAYAARMAATGGRGVVVVMTDGQSGLDQYPYRAVDSVRPAYDLSGEALKAVRISETAAAVTALGADAYVRLGLDNAPYNGLADEQTIPQVLERWGGYDALVGRLVELIRGFQPTVVLAPDAPRTTLEHFEHETTGFLVWEALARLSTAGAAPPIHLVAIDPLQRAQYPERLVNPVDNSEVRQRQVSALAAHITQRDASTIGVETRLAIGREYYGVAAWPEQLTMPAWLRIEDSSPLPGAVHPSQIRVPRPIGKLLPPRATRRVIQPEAKAVRQEITGEKADK